MRELLAELRSALEERRPCVWCSLIETRGSTPQKAGAGMLVFPDGSQRGTLGGGCVEAEVKRKLALVQDVRRFAKERLGLPAERLAAWPPDRLIRLPMVPGNRSLNLSNAVAVVVFEAWRQLGFPGA